MRYIFLIIFVCLTSGLRAQWKSEELVKRFGDFVVVKKTDKAGSLYFIKSKNIESLYRPYEKLKGPSKELIYFPGKEHEVEFEKWKEELSNRVLSDNVKEIIKELVKEFELIKSNTPRELLWKIAHKAKFSADICFNNTGKVINVYYTLSEEFEDCLSEKQILQLHENLMREEIPFGKENIWISHEEFYKSMYGIKKTDNIITMIYIDFTNGFKKPASKD